MEQKADGQLGDWATRYANAKPIDVAKKTSCLGLFKQGIGFRRSARILGLRPYTVRDWCRRFKRGDESWAKRDGRRFFRCSEAADLIKYRHEIETFVSGCGKAPSGDGPVVGPERPPCRGESQMAGGAEHAAAVPLYRADEACRRILAGESGKKKEIAAVRALVGEGRSVKEACRVAGIPRCSYYRALRPSRKAESDAELVRLMCDIENDRRVSSTYGIERLTGEVNNRLMKAGPELAAKILRNGARVNHKRVHRLMKEHGIHSRIRRRKHPDGYYRESRERLEKNRAPNILKRDFSAERPLAKLTTDVTYIPCRDRKFVYLSPLFDLFNHEIVSYAMSTVNSEEFVESMLAALPPGSLEGALIHNDQGSVYWSNGWVALCEELHVVRSMSRRGNCWDNAMSENFFSAMKADLGLTKLAYKRLLPEKDIRDLVNDYIPWYNAGRIQKKLGYMSPVQFREAFSDRALSSTVTDRPGGPSSVRAAASRLGPAARPFGDGAHPPHGQGTSHILDTAPTNLVYCATQ